ncbi:MAG: TIGR04282 family arsenosugar biosynthesis glycosyltransferase [Cyclobacteriaceae bacterium]
MDKSLLIIFVKNLVPGHVKTRLAEEIGIDGALDVYQYLVEHTAEITEVLEVDKAVFYSEYVEIEDIWDDSQYKLLIQKGKSLGERMSNAFQKAFEMGYEKVVLIGSDSIEISEKHLTEAFKQLDENSYVIGPAKDGGYYLLGMKEPTPAFFDGKKYGHDKVLKELLEEVAKTQKEFFLLDELSDIDTFQDLKDSDIDFQFVDPDEEDSH